jgi:hypothetical protein
LPEVGARMRSFGMEPITSTSEEYNVLAQKELAKWTELARANNISMQ